VVIGSNGNNSTFLLNGASTEFLGYGDLHDKNYDALVISNKEFCEKEEQQHEDDQIDHESDLQTHFCKNLFFVFPSNELQSAYKSNEPLTYTLVIIAIFVFAIIVFCVYDYYVTHRQLSTEQKANKSRAIIKELFPGSVADQLFDNGNTGKNNKGGDDYITSADDSGLPMRSIAEFYPEATVVFADIAGFTAWSSIREPQNVFALLEAIFQGFDTLAKRYGVFKVETVGGTVKTKILSRERRSNRFSHNGYCFFCIIMVLQIVMWL